MYYRDNELAISIPQHTNAMREGLVYLLCPLVNPDTQNHARHKAGTQELFTEHRRWKSFAIGQML